MSNNPNKKIDFELLSFVVSFPFIFYDFKYLKLIY